MTSANRAALASLFKRFDDFMVGDDDDEDIDSEIEELQWKLGATLVLLEGNYVDFVIPIEKAENDLEEIRFARLRDEQRAATIFRLDELREELESGLARDEELGARPPGS
jgi:hypothetical protein